MKLLKIKDNSWWKKELFSDIAKLTGKITDKTLEQLEREGVFVFPETVNEADDITRDQMILQSVNDTYQSGKSQIINHRHLKHLLIFMIQLSD